MLPTLNFKMFMRDDHIIEYRFYEKKMNSPYCVMAKSAMSESAKISAMSQEVVRRMCNTSDIVDQEMRDDIVDAFSAKLTRSGYSKQQVRTVIESGLKGYQNKLARCAKKGEMLHRPATSTATSRNRKKLLGKTNWFKKAESKDRNEHLGEEYRPSKTKERSGMNATRLNH